MSGPGNAYIGFRLGLDNEAVNYSSILEATAPTGDKAKGFSTGRGLSTGPIVSATVFLR